MFDCSDLHLFRVEEQVPQEAPLDVLSTADLLGERWAFLTGGTARSCPILTFPDNPHRVLAREAYEKLITYLTQVPRYDE